MSATGLHRVFPARLAALALALALAGGLAPAPLAQRSREPVVSAQLSTGVAKLGEQVVLTIVVENARSARIRRAPSVEGLVLGEPAGPFSSQYTQIVNGRVSERVETRWQVAVRSSDEGQFDIPPFELEVDGKAVRTRPVTLKVLRDLRGEDIGFFEITSSSPKVVEGQPFTLELRFGWDEASPVNYANLSLPWWGALPGTLDLERDPSTAASEMVVVNDEIKVGVERLPSPPGEQKRVYRFVRSFLPTRSGTLEFPTSFLEFGRLSERRLFSAQRKVSNYFVRAEPLELEVVPLPREGQPYDYSGAVGSLEVRASADTRDVVVGDSIKLTMVWTGAGNLEFFEAPDLALLDSFRGFQVYGSTEDKSFDRRRVVYDLAPIDAEVDVIPSVPLSVFDPERGAYVTLDSDPIPIRVRPLERAISLTDSEEERFVRDISDIDARPLGTSAPSGEGDGALGDRLLGASFALVPLGWLGLRTLRRRHGDPAAPQERRRRRARRVLARAVAKGPEPKDTLHAFTSFLAARTREPDEAWTGRDIAAWREAHGAGGVPAAEWDEAAELCRRLERAVYGEGAAVAPDEVLDTADRLVRSGL